MDQRPTSFGPSGKRQVRIGAVILVVLLPALLAAAALAHGDPARAPLWVGLGGLLAVVLVIGGGEALRPVVLLDDKHVRVRTGRRWITYDRARVERVEERRSAPGEPRRHHAVLLGAGGEAVGEIDLDEVADPGELLRSLRTRTRS